LLKTFGSGVVCIENRSLGVVDPNLISSPVFAILRKIPFGAGFIRWDEDSKNIWLFDDYTRNGKA
jgi:hypothetical protein